MLCGWKWTFVYFQQSKQKLKILFSRKESSPQEVVLIKVKLIFRFHNSSKNINTVFKVGYVGISKEHSGTKIFLHISKELQLRLKFEFNKHKTKIIKQQVK